MVWPLSSVRTHIEEEPRRWPRRGKNSRLTSRAITIPGGCGVNGFWVHHDLGTSRNPAFLADWLSAHDRQTGVYWFKHGHWGCRGMITFDAPSSDSSIVEVSLTYAIERHVHIA